MKLNKNEKIVLKKYLDSIIICICSFVSDEEIKICLEKSQTVIELILNISEFLKTKELDGWEGDDLMEEQLNVLTIRGSTQDPSICPIREKLFIKNKETE